MLPAMRQKQGSMVCPHCNKLIGINEPECPFCGAWRPGLFGWTPALQRVVGQHLDLISLISITCVLLYTVALLLQPEAITDLRGVLSLLSPGSRALYQLGMTGGVAWQLGWWWTLLTAIYLHGSLLHIFFNLMWIRNLGPVATEVYGPARAFVLFSAAGAAGFLLSNLMHRRPDHRRLGQRVWLAGRAHRVRSASRQLADDHSGVAVGDYPVHNWVHFARRSTTSHTQADSLVGWVAASRYARSATTQRESSWVLLTALALIGITVPWAWCYRSST